MGLIAGGAAVEQRPLQDLPGEAIVGRGAVLGAAWL